MYLLRSTDKFVALLLQGTQQLHLCLHVQVADFIQKQCPVVGGGKHAALVLHRSGKSPLLMPEQFRCGQFPWKGSAVHCYERGGRTLAESVYLPCHPLLARTRRPAYQHGQTVRRSHQTYHLLKSYSRRAFADVEVLFHRPFPPTPQQSADDTEHLFRLHGLGQIIVGPFLHGLHGTGYVPITRHDKKGHTVAVSPHPFEQFHAVAVTQTEIRENQSRFMAAQKLLCGVRREHVTGVHAVSSQPVGGGACVCTVILHYEYCLHSFSPLMLRPSLQHSLQP